ncbi:type II secretion system secretin GspD [Photobacterium rosenbergii]|uniref:type II secretion system secretin GspD n=1 Tax=Photobacterium rosenbergii TaxID=294936 RepID=UPI001C98F683|nr:type II secretion system secretin GspD [Photobacterium rosenbergii]MBY5947382.1 type II secretion system secretin GspD [Photobacterium rosenbergii]
MNQQAVKRISVVGVAVLLSGCAARPFGEDVLRPMGPNRPVETAQMTLSEKQAPLHQEQMEYMPIPAAPVLGANMSNDGISENLNLPTSPVSINAQDLALNKFVKLTLGEILGVSYILDQSLSNNTRPVTLHINEPVNSARMLGLVEEVLRLSDVALLKDKDVIKVVPLSKATNLAPEVVDRNVKRLLRYGQVIEFVPINYMPLGQASQLAYTFINQGKGQVLTQNHLNAIVLVGEQQDIDRFRQTLSLIDQPSPISKYTAIVSPAYVSAHEIIETFNETMPIQGIPVVKRTVSDTGNVTTSGVNGVSITPIGDTNRLLLTSSNTNWLSYARYWLQQIDKPKNVVAGEMNIFTYFLQNTQAQDVSSVIEQVFGDGQSNRSSKTEDKKTTESAVRPANLSLANQEKEESGSRNGGASTLASNSDRYKIVVDETRNALIFMGTYDDYSQVLELLKVLDRRPRQVLIEASVMEVTLDDSLDFGVNWNTSGSSGGGGTAGPKGDGTGGLALASGGLFLTGTFGDFTASLSAAAKDGKVHILSSPRLLAKDGEDARISVGTQIAVKTGSVSSGDNNGQVVESFSYIDTGVILEITPTINESGLVEMSVSQEVSEAGESESATTPPILKRQIETMLVAETGQTVVLGGLISQNQSSTVNKVPFFGDIPVLGQLFKTTSIQDRKTELVVTLTPHIIYNRTDADFYTQEFRNLFGWDLVTPQIEMKL